MSLLVLPEETEKSKKDEAALEADDVTGDGTEDPEQSGVKELPVDTESVLSGGVDPTENDYDEALTKLESEDDVDIVLVSIDNYSN